MNADSIARHHTLVEERALIVAGRDSVPVVISIIVRVPVQQLKSNEALALESSSVESSSVDALPIGATTTGVGASTIGAAAPETAGPGTAALGRS